MRQYRGLTKDGKWVYGWYMEHPFKDDPTKPLSVIVQDEIPYEVLPETVGQQIGKQDKSGKEIYGGDILQLAYETLSLRGIVQQTESGLWELYKDEDNHIGVHHNIDRVEIIGNIHENPELLEKP